jgi:hypothetical protein
MNLEEAQVGLGGVSALERLKSQNTHHVKGHDIFIYLSPEGPTAYCTSCGEAKHVANDLIANPQIKKYFIGKIIEEKGECSHSK